MDNSLLTLKVKERTPITVVTMIVFLSHAMWSTFHYLVFFPLSFLYKPQEIQFSIQKYENMSAILDKLDLVGTVAAGIFAGSALYITVIEVPSAADLGVETHWKFFPFMYDRAYVMQSSLAALAGLTGIAHGTRVVGSAFDRNLWIAAGSAFVALWPYTLGIMLSTNNTISKDSKLVTQGQTSQFDLVQRKDLLQKWACLHSGRTAISVIGFGAMIYGLSRHSSLLLKW